jgi:hypothetical protein
MEPPAYTAYLYNRNGIVSTHACSLLPEARTPTILRLEGRFVRSLRYPMADLSKADRQCKSPHPLPAPGSVAVPAHTSYNIPRRVVSIGLGLILGIGIHGALGANI